MLLADAWKRALQNKSNWNEINVWKSVGSVSSEVGYDTFGTCVWNWGQTAFCRAGMEDLRSPLLGVDRSYSSLITCLVRGSPPNMTSTQLNSTRGVSSQRMPKNIWIFLKVAFDHNGTEYNSELYFNQITVTKRAVSEGISDHRHHLRELSVNVLWSGCKEENTRIISLLALVWPIR